MLDTFDFKKYLLTVTAYVFSGGQCKWSNENCDVDEDCCSKRCVRLHEGTFPRCAKSPMHYPCFFGYQCEKGLACGEVYSCCAPFWGVCVKKDDCCEADHVCRQMDGFTYNRCLPNSAKRTLGNWISLVLTVLTVVKNWSIWR